MTFRRMLLGTAVAVAVPGLFLSGPAAAQGTQTAPAEGFYLGVQGGATWLTDPELEGALVENEADTSIGWTALGEAGYRLANGLRLGAEIGRTHNGIDDIVGGGPGRVGGDGDVNAWTFMGIVAYEFDLGLPVRPYIQAGGGVVRANFEDVGPVFAAGNFADDRDTGLAWQVGGGVTYALSDNLELTASYRYLSSSELDIVSAGGDFDSDYRTHTALVGVRFLFGAAPPPPAPAPAAVRAAPTPPPPPPPPPPPAISRNFTVFFDWDRSDLTADAQQVLQNVARDARTGNIALVTVTGHADTSGPADYNERLSMRRAESIRDYLVSLGMGQNEIDIQGVGETELLVPTTDGVREPSNRRGVIIFPEPGA